MLLFTHTQQAAASTNQKATIMSKVNELIDKTLEDLYGKIDKYTLNAFSTLVFSMIIEGDYSCWLRIKALMEKAIAKCEAGVVHYSKIEGEPPEILPKFIEFTFFMKLALHLGKQVELDHAKARTPPELH
jgi:hypothetical protein